MGQTLTGRRRGEKYIGKRGEKKGHNSGLSCAAETHISGSGETRQAAMIMMSWELVPNTGKLSHLNVCVCVLGFFGVNSGFGFRACKSQSGPQMEGADRISEGMGIQEIRQDWIKPLPGIIGVKKSGY